MKSKRVKPIVVASIVVLILVLVYWTQDRSGPLARSLDVEFLENTFPEKPDQDQIMPFGYTLGQWPSHFLGEPIVMKMTYQKGPPTKFIQTMVQLWKPVEVELTLRGPKTIDAKMSAADWKTCLTSTMGCRNEKRQLIAYALPAGVQKNNQEIKANWFDSLDPLGPRGLRLQIDSGTYFTDHYVILTEKGAAQDFSLKYVKNPVGLAAHELFIKTISGLKVKDDLSSARAWIQTRIQSVRLDDARALKNLRTRLATLIQIQNWIFSLLSVDPTKLDPYFHLAGVTHLLAIELMKAKEHTYESQEAWILNSIPLLNALILYAKDFNQNQEVIKNMESLLQDVLLLQQKMSSH